MGNLFLSDHYHGEYQRPALPEFESPQDAEEASEQSARYVTFLKMLDAGHGHEAKTEENRFENEAYMNAIYTEPYVRLNSSMMRIEKVRAATSPGERSSAWQEFLDEDNKIHVEVKSGPISKRATETMLSDLIRKYFQGLNDVKGTEAIVDTYKRHVLNQTNYPYFAAGMRLEGEAVQETISTEEGEVFQFDKIPSSFWMQADKVARAYVELNSRHDGQTLSKDTLNFLNGNLVYYQNFINNEFKKVTKEVLKSIPVPAMSREMILASDALYAKAVKAARKHAHDNLDLLEEAAMKDPLNNNQEIEKE